MKPTDPETGGPPQNSGEPASVFCPNCGARLRQLQCKLVCDGCGYFMSCSDYY